MNPKSDLEKKTQPGAATTAEDVDVYPLHAIDQFDGLRWMISWMMRFNDILDASKLETSLARLLEIGDWRKLGGRLRFKNSRDLEIYVPKSSTAERPTFSFTHDTSLADTSIEDHLVARQFPKPTTQPSIQPMPREKTRPFQGPPDCPETVEELCKTGKPLMLIRVTTFNDATLVAITWPHSLMDAFGQRDLLRNWSLVMAGREQEVVPVLAAQDDILKELENLDSGEYPAEFKLGSQRMSKLNLILFYFRLLWYKFRSGPTEIRMIHISKAIHATLLREARDQVAKISKDRGEKLFVSDADVLVAWFVKGMASLESNSRPVLAATTLNPRFCLPSLRSTRGAYIQNMTLLQCTSVPPKLARGSLGEIALRHRHHLREQATEKQVLAYLRCLRQDKEAGKELLPLAGDARSRGIFINDLTRIDVIQAADFGPAVVHKSEKAELRHNPPGTMVSYYCRTINEEKLKGPYFTVYGKDHGENLWILGCVNWRVWGKVEEELHRLEQRHNADVPESLA